jgi:hypothetical protein
MGQPTQVTGTAAESAAAAATNGFLGWSPDSNRAVYTVGSGSTNKKGAARFLTPRPASSSSTARSSGGLMATKKSDSGEAEVQANVDAENEQGFRGARVDPTPLENYTLEGVTSGAPTPETDEKAAEAARQASRGL